MQLPHDPLQTPEIIEHIDQVLAKMDYKTLDKFTAAQFEADWRKWLADSSHNSMIGLDGMKHCAFCPGTTDAFGEFVSRYHDNRIRVSRSDFIITRVLSKAYGRNLCYLEDDELRAGDSLIISVPFSGNGAMHPEFDRIMDTCDGLDIPVFIDAAYFGISHGITYDLTRPCVKDIATSLSKNFVGNPLRLGVRFTKDLVDDSITIALLGANVFDKVNGYISSQLLRKFPQDWLIEKYMDKSKTVCERLNLKPTNTLTLAMGDESMQEYKRGDYIRVCISNHLSG
jgi:hypothetical protein